MKYSKMRIFLAVLAAAVTVVSCKEPQVVNPAKGLNLSTSSTTAEFGAASASITIVAHVDWTLSVIEGAGWITPDVTSGKAHTTLKVNFTIAPNDGETARTGKVSIKAAGEKDPYLFTITQNAKNTLTGINAWIHEQLSGWYYWNDVVKATAPPSNTLAYDKFLAATITALPWADVQDRSNGESPATIDGEYMLDPSSGNMVSPPTRDHIYSYIERTGGPATRAAEGEEKTFGFSVMPFGLGSGLIGYLVTLVRPDSPADKAGMKRGMWILKYNGANMTESNYQDLQYQLLWFEGGDNMNISLDTDGNLAVDQNGNLVTDKDASLTAVEMKMSPIIHHEVITTGGGKKVAYLLYNEFEWGPEESNGTHEFENDLRDLFGEFKTAGATQLVLDLRYNGGGYVHTCQVLTSLIGNVNTTDVFCKSLRNKDIKDVEPRMPNPYIDHFLNEGNSLKLTRVYVLATRDTASASEMVINALRGVDIEVVHIGERTNGKNVGMDLLETTIDGYDYELRPITFKIMNAKDNTDYADGFGPNHTKDEFWDLTNENGSGILHDFGTDANGRANERLLKTALDLIDGRSVSHDTRAGKTRAGDGAMQPLPALKDPRRRGGAIYVREK